jgi:hypothetical protein
MPRLTLRQYQREQQERLDKVQAAIDFYKGLSPKVKVGCRAFEAFNLLVLGKTIATITQMREIKTLLDNKLNVRLGCDCSNLRCEWAHESELGGSECVCLANNSFCLKTYVYVEDRRTGNFYYGRPQGEL